MPKTFEELSARLEQIGKEAASRLEGEDVELPDFATMDAEIVFREYVYFAVGSALALTGGPHADSDLIVLALAALWKQLCVAREVSP